MKKYVRITFVGILGLIAVAYPVWWWLTPVHRVNMTSLSQIRVGMALSKVEAIFGLPPGDYSEQSKTIFTIYQDPEGFPQGWRRETWQSPNALCVVYFDRDDKVLCRAGCEAHSPSWFDQIKNWLGV